MTADMAEVIALLKRARELFREHHYDHATITEVDDFDALIGYMRRHQCPTVEQS